ncbi:ABC transporter ATP-binding protein [Methanomassiliicoccus luminyensis]|uniref:ABC transporter ATP-binding protein n=1 Tax=Methanomassiliicoccus luminyensis TaxID=1080712 RepID=UPI0003763266|nr:ABC transporter ATP-binding protein [Methanomassiliicoccus luminyensis]
MSGTVLEVRELRAGFDTPDGRLEALDGVSFEVRRGEVFGIVGESGCGKSVTASCILRLLPPSGSIGSGTVLFAVPEETMDLIRELRASGKDNGGLRMLVGEWDLLGRSEGYMRQIRGDHISMVFQDPASALNPVLTVGRQISEVVLAHRGKELAEAVLAKADSGEGKRHRLVRPFIARMKEDPDSLMLRAARRIPVLRRYRRPVEEEAWSRAEEMLRLMQVPDPPRMMNSYPFELSGGMQQRATIAMALINRPRLLIADEPTTSLDVTIQAQILELMRRLQKEMGSSILLITHNLGVVAETCDRVGVMYAGSMVEIGPVDRVLKDPLHPYTRGLLDAVPRLDRSERLSTIQGSVPDPLDPPSGCRFHPRCPRAMDICRTERPAPVSIGPDRQVCCHLCAGVRE